MRIFVSVSFPIYVSNILPVKRIIHVYDYSKLNILIIYKNESYFTGWSYLNTTICNVFHEFQNIILKNINKYKTKTHEFVILKIA